MGRKRIWALDLDGVLCEVPRESKKPWRNMDADERAKQRDLLLAHYHFAKPLHWDIPEKFYVITARRDEFPVVAATTQWLSRKFGSRVLGVRFLDRARNINNVVDFKVDQLLEIGATDFVEDNERVVRRMRQFIDLDARVWLFKKGDLHE